MESLTADEVVERIVASAAAHAFAPAAVAVDDRAYSPAAVGGRAVAHAAVAGRDSSPAGAAAADILDSAARDAGTDASDPLRRQVNRCLDRLGEIARREARTAAEKVRVIAEFVEGSMALAAPAGSPQEASAQEMAVIAELACALTVSERAASALIAESRELTTTLPLTLAALQAGAISWQHARVMVDETSNMDPAGAAALEAHFLDPFAENPARGCPAGELVPSRFRHKARIWRERHHPVSIEKRHTKSVADRRLQYTPDRDGMAWLSAYLPADQAVGVWNRITAAARALQGPDQDLTLTQLRADTFATLLLGGTVTATTSGGNSKGTDGAGGSTGRDADGAGGDPVNLPAGVPVPRAQVLVTVPLISLLGHTAEPAMLDGYGPIPVTMVRRLIAEGATSFHRVLLDPRDGAPLEIGRMSYPVTTAQRQWLRLRDGRCPFPGCNNHSLDNEADHLLPWAHGGTTGISNLAQPCPKHHRLRHTTGWKPGPASQDEPPGWISPTGRRYASEHPDWEPPQLPEHWAEPSAETSGEPSPRDATNTQAEAEWPSNLQPDAEPPEDLYGAWFDVPLGHPLEG